METYVITEACIDVKDGSCVDVCPVACIHTTDEARQYYIDPKICIECEQCVVVCPVNAIYLDTDVPEHLAQYIEMNAQFFAEMTRPVEPISAEIAHVMIEAAASYGATVGASLSIAVVDQHGLVVAEQQMAGAAGEGAEAAIANANRAVTGAKRSSGASPVVDQLDLVGGIGVSGGSEDENTLAARAGVAARDDARDVARTIS